MRTLSIFSLFGVLGPVIRFFSWPFSMQEQCDRDFVYTAVLVLWPTQPLSAIEAVTGNWLGIAAAVTSNILIFSVVGIAVKLYCGSGIRLLLAYFLVCATILTFVVWELVEIEDLNLMALFVALVLYGSPFLANWIFSRRLAPQRSSL